MTVGISKDQEFSGAYPVEKRHRIDEASLARCLASMSKVCGTPDRTAVQGRPV